MIETYKVLLAASLTVLSAIATAANAQAQQPFGRTTGLQFQERPPRYKIQTDDILAISFPLSPELDQTVSVQPDGFINLQSTNSIYVRDFTVPEIVDIVKRAYTNVLHNAIVNVDLKDYQKPYFVILGQVTKPSRYDLRYAMTVSEAVATAGGFLPSAKTQVFVFHRVNDNWAEVRQVVLNKTFQGKITAEDAAIKPGDLLFVPEKFIVKFRKYIPYGVGMGFNPSSLLF